MASIEQSKVKRAGLGLRAPDHDQAFRGFTLFVRRRPYIKSVRHY